jgi:hypothetical protein
MEWIHYVDGIQSLKTIKDYELRESRNLGWCLKRLLDDKIQKGPTIGSMRAFITLMTETVRTSETSVYFNETIRRCIAEKCLIHTRRREYVKTSVTGSTIWLLDDDDDKHKL